MPDAKHSIRRTRNGAGPEAGSIIRRAGSFTARQSSQAGGQDGIGECSIIYEILRSKGGGTYRPRQPVSMRRCSPHVPITVGPRNRNLACTCTMCRVHWACAGLLWCRRGHGTRKLELVHLLILRVGGSLLAVLAVVPWVSQIPCRGQMALPSYPHHNKSP